MKTAKYVYWLQRTVRWMLFAVIVLYGVTGYGITEYRIVEDLTLGLLSKPLAFKWHSALLIPFVALLVLHISLPSILRRLKLKRR
ncbi:hypothetical protein ACFLX5_02960 [Chloroflexota bacterium]